MKYDRLQKLDRLHALRKSGALTEDEFEDEKAKLLDINIFDKVFLGLIVFGILFVTVAFFNARSPKANSGLPASASAPLDKPNRSNMPPTIRPRITVATATPAEKISRVFDSDMLGAQNAYLESIVGPAIRVYGSQRTYKVGNCNIIVMLNKGRINSISMDVSNQCSFSFDHLYQGLGNAKDLTIGKITNAIWGVPEFYSDCFTNCPNIIGDPEVSFIENGSIASGSFSISVEIDTVTNISPSPTDQLASAMAIEGENYIESKKYNCDRKYDKIASQLYWNTPISSVTIYLKSPNMDKCLVL